MADPVRDLSNYLQSHPSGNLTPLLLWETKQEGPLHQVTHYVHCQVQRTGNWPRVGPIQAYGKGHGRC
ncbi:hypothetical protein EDB87DRAFT_1835549 [Lactarius vividus]|nr:hypothetical protein EDB87DRAFT_1835549 [Lactarius vividus]